MQQRARAKCLQRCGIAIKDWLDVDHGSPIDRLNPLNSDELTSLYAKDLGAVKTYRIGPVGGTSREYSRESSLSARVHFERGTPRFMQPCQHPNGLSGLNPIEPFNPLRIDFQRGFRRALPGLPRSTGSLNQGGMYVPDWGEVIGW